MLTLGYFSTGGGEGSRGLLRMVVDAIQRGDLDARIDYVFCNRDPGEHTGTDEFMALVRSYGLPLVTHSSRGFRRRRQAPSFAAVRQEYDREVMALLAPYDPAVCVLAGYMLIVGDEMCRHYTMLNLHPALPDGPVGTWQQVIWKLIESRAPKTGATIHLATEELDRGPAVTYVSFPLSGQPFVGLWETVRGRPIDQIKGEEGEDFPLFASIRQAGMRREQPLLLETLRALALGRVQADRPGGNDALGSPAQGLCLNDEVERALSRESESAPRDPR
jgi:folate-dependent phosphoribosylglycinamide formyltransferase PurN